MVILRACSGAAMSVIALTMMDARRGAAGIAGWMLDCGPPAREGGDDWCPAACRGRGDGSGREGGSTLPTASSGEMLAPSSFSLWHRQSSLLVPKLWAIRCFALCSFVKETRKLQLKSFPTDETRSKRESIRVVYARILQSGAWETDTTVTLRWTSCRAGQSMCPACKEQREQAGFPSGAYVRCCVRSCSRPSTRSARCPGPPVVLSHVGLVDRRPGSARRSVASLWRAHVGLLPFERRAAGSRPLLRRGDLVRFHGAFLGLMNVPMRGATPSGAARGVPQRYWAGCG